MAYKTIFIDWDGTLSRSRFWDRWSRDADTYPRYQLIQEALFHSDEGRLLIKDWMRGLRSASNILKYLNEMTGINYDELESELRYSCEHMTLIDESVIDKIRQLRARGIKAVIATDNMDVFRLITVPALKLDQLFDEIITSDTKGAFKKEMNDDGTSPFFDRYLRQNNLKPHESAIIDDSLDTNVVENWGIDFLHVNQDSSLAQYLDDFLSLRD